MAFKRDSGPITYEIDDDINELIEEKGNMITMLRKVAWGNRDKNLEIRKWVAGIDGEKPMKGVSFMTPEGPSNLIYALLDHKYGETKEVIEHVKDRDDFEDSLVQVIGKKKVEASKKVTVITKEDYFDPKEIIV